jgi:hypothetical protein
MRSVQDTAVVYIKFPNPEQGVVDTIRPAMRVEVEGHLEQCASRIREIGHSVLGGLGPWKIATATFRSQEDALQGRLTAILTLIGDDVRGVR